MVSPRIGDASLTGTLPIRLGCVDSFAATVGPELIRAVSGSARQIALWSGLTPGLTKQLHDREIDMAVCTQTVLSDARIVEIPLFSEAFVVGGGAQLSGWPRRHRLAYAGAGTAVDPLYRAFGDWSAGRTVSHGIWASIVARRYEFDATDPLLSLVTAKLGFAISTPLCLWQARHYLDDIAVLPLPPSRLGRRDFFLLHRQGEWEEFAGEIVTLTRRVLDHTHSSGARPRAAAPAGRCIALSFTTTRPCRRRHCMLRARWR